MENQPPSEKDELVVDAVGFKPKKLLSTLKELTLRPGQAMTGYCEGSRSLLISPITYFFLAFGLNYFLTFLNPGVMDSMVQVQKITDAFENGLRADGSMDEEKITQFMAALQRTLSFVFSKEGMLLTTWPIIALFQWLFFKKYKKRFIHHLYFLLFVFAHANILTLPLIALVALSPALLTATLVAGSIATLAYYVYAQHQFYRLPLMDMLGKTAIMFVAAAIPFFIWFYAVMFAAMGIILKFKL